MAALQHIEQHRWWNYDTGGGINSIVESTRPVVMMLYPRAIDGVANALNSVAHLRERANYYERCFGNSQHQSGLGVGLSEVCPLLRKDRQWTSYTRNHYFIH